jgi:hypothetical protein
MRFLSFYPEGWWRDPKHAITIDATVVEAGRPRFPGYSGYDQKVVVELKDPETGQDVRAKSTLLTDAQGVQVGQVLRIRWSAKRKEFELWDSSTAPKDEWFGGTGAFGMAGAGGLAPMGGVQIINASGADPAELKAKLEKLRGLGMLSDAQLDQAEAQVGTTASSPSGDQPSGPAGEVESVQERLHKLEQLRDAGALDQPEYDKQRQRILDSL